MTKLHYLLQQLTQKLAEHQFMQLIMQINPNKDNNNGAFKYIHLYDFSDYFGDFNAIDDFHDFVIEDGNDDYDIRFDADYIDLPLS